MTASDGKAPAVAAGPGLFGGTYFGRTVLVTGHTGFKGSWLALWLSQLGARVVGVALDPPTRPSHFEACGAASDLTDLRLDLRDFQALRDAMHEHRPQIVFHLAAQSLVGAGYADPRGTFEVNVMGTVNVLEAARLCPSVQAVVVVTSDKTYRNLGWEWSYRETDALGGHEPYGGSKACAELIAEVYGHPGFQANAVEPRSLAIATARAGNVIGGGDWSAARLVPDFVRAAMEGGELMLRNPRATRPWQHVLDCLSGYLQLAARLHAAPGEHAGAWNFGPDDSGAKPVEDIVRGMSELWPQARTRVTISPDPPGREAQALRVDSSRAIQHLGWRPCWQVNEALRATADWYRSAACKQAPGAMRAASLGQIAGYVEAARGAGIGWAA
jgi:CDP-glucose 4,6-dehydratase